MTSPPRATIKGHDGGHSLYHEAVKRASRPQDLRRHTSKHGLLLTAPNNMIFELFDTVLFHVPADKIHDYIHGQLKGYLETNWTNKTIQRSITRLRREQCIDQRAGIGRMPHIGRITSQIKAVNMPSNAESSITAVRSLEMSSSTALHHNKQPSATSTTTNKQQSPQTESRHASSGLAFSKENTTAQHNSSQKVGTPVQVYEHIMWRIKSNQVNQITSLIIKLALEDGYKTGKLKVQAYPEVAEQFGEWRSRLLIKLYAFGCAPANDQRLILSSTNLGDLTKWVANYIDGTDKKQDPSLIAKLASALRDKTRNCVFVTHDLDDALSSYATGALRCVLLLDRDAKLEPLEQLKNFASTIKPLISSGRLYIMSSLDCVQFAPDPTSANCC